jgi:hypothetical protein
VLPDEIPVSFGGPFSWPGTPDAPSIFDVNEGLAAGIYLFTVPLSDGNLIYYVGETGRTFRARLFEHYTEHASGMYHVFAPAEFARGEKVMLWPGRFDMACRKPKRDCIAAYPDLCGPIWEMTRMFQLFVAPLTCDQRVRCRIEAAIANALYATPGAVGNFQDKVNYSPRSDGETPIRCIASSSARLLGLPERFEA